MQFEFFPEHGYVGHFKVVDRKLLFVGKADVGVLKAGRPFDVIHAIYVL